MKRSSTDRGAMVLAVLILALLWFFYGKSGNVQTEKELGTQPKTLVETGDIQNGLPDWYTYLQENDYTNTRSVEEFGGNDIITRATSTPFLARYGYISALEEKSTLEECSFPDITAKSDDLQKTIRVACVYDLLRGSGGDFIPDRVLTKQELLTILVRSKTGYLSEDTSPWYKNYFERAQNNGLVAGETIEDITGEVTKATLGQRLYNLSLLE